MKMCIICNCGDDGDNFLYEYEVARGKMKKAREAMLKCSQVATDEESRKRYKATYNKMASIIKDWNSIEEFRENVKIDEGNKNLCGGQ